MRAASTEERNADHLPEAPRRRFTILTMLLSLNAFVVGGCITLLIVNRLLNSQLDVYTAAQTMAAASAILDFMDDLLYFYFIYGAVLLVLVLSTASVWTWMMTQSRILRYGTILLCVIVLVVLGGVWLMGGKGIPVVPQTTPTPSIESSLLMLEDILWDAVEKA